MKKAILATLILSATVSGHAIADWGNHTGQMIFEGKQIKQCGLEIPDNSKGAISLNTANATSEGTSRSLKLIKNFDGDFNLDVSTLTYTVNGNASNETDNLDIIFEVEGSSTRFSYGDNRNSFIIPGSDFNDENIAKVKVSVGAKEGLILDSGIHNVEIDYLIQCAD